MSLGRKSFCLTIGALFFAGLTSMLTVSANAIEVQTDDPSDRLIQEGYERATALAETVVFFKSKDGKLSANITLNTQTELNVTDNGEVIINSAPVDTITKDTSSEVSYNINIDSSDSSYFSVSDSADSSYFSFSDSVDSSYLSVSDSADSSYFGVSDSAESSYFSVSDSADSSYLSDSAYSVSLSRKLQDDTSFRKLM
ncbi:PREDICTED: dentin sialophosphoprotein-like [Bactrocera latifrons]|uniref:dentin sialophosphoprotein-like n=1 Tax=Bactrocera latifrons TaxID=174628 RepID=UPI0008DE7ED8|nr:PREDICTED: dentin sialophosphoprotein-like [Bactrocera latifrons]